ncbi:MAG: MinD/ParA family protein [Bacillota bacterium]
MNGLLKLTSEDRFPRQGARVIAVTSGKGGVGKTNLVVNLSLALARLGRRVIILDADLGLANAEVLMGVTPLYTLFDCLSGRKEINEILTPAPLGVQIISGGSGFVELANLDSRQQQKIIDALVFLDEADFVLIDTGAGISRNVLGFVAAAEEVIVVLTPEPTSLTDAYSLIKILAKFKVHRQVMLVVNRAADEREAAATVKKMAAVVERFLEMQLVHLGSICEDRAVLRAVRGQRPFVLFEPQSRPALNIEFMARRLANEECSVPQGKTFRGFVQKMVRFFR